MNVHDVVVELKKHTDAVRARASMRYFKTGKGEYGEGDVFWGITVPQMRLIAKKYPQLTLTDIETLLESQVHECRLTAVFILLGMYRATPETGKKELYDFYLSHTNRFNNWDLVDSSAGQIVGNWLLHRTKDRKILYRLAKDQLVWNRRIAIIATSAFIRAGEYDDTVSLAEILLYDSHDLMHKAVGWMLREVGKKDQKVLETFLLKYRRLMPRTMLRYAIERFDTDKRRFYMM